MLLFILSEAMLFWAMFASYFFIRVVAHEGPWPPEGFELPVAVAFVNSLILVSSSVTVHWVLQRIRFLRKGRHQMHSRRRSIPASRGDGAARGRLRIELRLEGYASRGVRNLAR